MDFYASSNQVVIYQINTEDLFTLAKDNIQISDRLKIVKLRIKNKHVDDIDYFTFP